MAKWGEGDPRWIVEERPDATNVNNWHWSEKNADHWSKSKISDIFENLVINGSKKDSKIEVSISEVEKIEGEARVNNRKSKLIFFYEWDITLKYTGKVSKTGEEKNGGSQIEGKIVIPNLSEEHVDLKDVDIEVSVQSPSVESTLIRDFLRKDEGASLIRQKLQLYVDALKSQYSKGLILETKSNKGEYQCSLLKDQVDNMNENKLHNLSIYPTNDVNKPSTKLPNSFTTISFTERFKCTGQELYNALTQREMLSMFTRSPCDLSSDIVTSGTTFTLLNGIVSGEFTQLLPFTKIVMLWRLSHWKPQSHSACVEINIKQENDDTVLKMRADNVPEVEAESAKQGWRRYYWDSIRNTFGYGTNIM